MSPPKQFVGKGGFTRLQLRMGSGILQEGAAGTKKSPKSWDGEVKAKVSVRLELGPSGAGMGLWGLPLQGLDPVRLGQGSTLRGDLLANLDPVR